MKTKYPQIQSITYNGVDAVTLLNNEILIRGEMTNVCTAEDARTLVQAILMLAEVMEQNDE